MRTTKIYCAFGTDIDSVAGWIGSYGGGDSPSDIQRGVFATEVGIPRLLRLFKKYGLRTSFFIPGHSLETFPDQMRMIVDDGARGRCPWLSARKPNRHDPPAGRGRAGQVHRADRRPDWTRPAWLCGALVGNVELDRCAAPEIQLQL